MAIVIQQWVEKREYFNSWIPEVHLNPASEFSLYLTVTQYISITKINHLIIFMDVITLYCENYTKHINKMRSGMQSWERLENWYIEILLCF